MSYKLHDNLVDKAARIAVAAHKDQKRKTDGSPYIVHPFMVAQKLTRYDFSLEAIAAGLVHDVLEDTDFPESDLKMELGVSVLTIVKLLSEDKSLEWEVRKEQYAQTIKNAPKDVKAVSAADKIHNLASVIEAYKMQGSDVWKKFNRGKDKKMWFENLVLEAVKDDWDHPIIREYQELLREVEKLN